MQKCLIKIISTEENEIYLQNHTTCGKIDQRYCLLYVLLESKSVNLTYSFLA